MDSENITIHSAAKSNDLEVAELLLMEKIDIYDKDKKGKTPLHILIQKRIEMFISVHKNWETKASINDIENNEKFIDMLLKYASTDPDCTDDIWLLNFHAACTLENCATAESHLEKIADVNQSISKKSSLWPGYTGLHFAAHCNVELLKMLIGKGGNLLTRDAKDVTPLDICIKSFSFGEVYSVLMSVTAWKDILFSDGKTKLMDYISVLQSSDDQAKFLQNTDEAVQLSLLKDSPLWPGYTVLHIAVTLLDKSKDVIIEDILNKGADVTIQDSHGSTPIHLAFRLDKIFILPTLFEHHKKVLNPLDQDSLSHLHIACATYSKKMVKKLLTIEDDVNVIYTGRALPSVKPGWTPLHTASFADHTVIARMLLGAGANLHQTDVKGFTAIHRLLGTDRKRYSVLDVLTASDQFKDCVVKGNGFTHLHVMAYWNKIEMVKRLLDSGSDIEAIIKKTKSRQMKKFVGYRPLHFAMMNNHSETVELLVKRGADILAKKPDGTCPLTDSLTCEYKDSVLELFIPQLWSDKKMQKRMEKETGLTMLHVVCYALDVEKIKSLLKKKVDVDARVREDSAIWRGWTALHILTFLGVAHAQRKGKKEKINESLDLLLDKKADVTLTTVHGYTPVHLSLRFYYKDMGRIRASLLMKYHNDFSVNPTSKEGLSHFHVACLVCNPTAVKSFLQRGADVNEPVKESAQIFAGKSPLHLALDATAKRLFGAEMQLQTVDLLLKHGAKVDAVDASGWTILHCVAECGPARQKLLNRIVGTETDMNKKTICGQTPFEILIESGASIKEIKYFIDQGSQVNSYNHVDNQGYIGRILYDGRYEKSLKHVLELIMSSPDIAKADKSGRNAIHNAVGRYNKLLNEKELAGLIEKLIKLGCDLHQQDRKGTTPLHLAVELCNEEAIHALLMCGADVNVVDFAGKSPFSYCPKPTVTSTAVYYEFELTALIVHLRKIQLVGLEVSQLNYRLLADAHDARFDEIALRDQLDKTKKVKIGLRGLTLYDFVFKKDVAKIISSFTPAERDIVGQVLESIDYEEFSDLRHLLKLQYRKVLQRLLWITPATKSLIILLEFPLPDLCIEAVLKFLNNVELKCLVLATIENNDFEIATN